MTALSHVVSLVLDRMWFCEWHAVIVNSLISVGLQVLLCCSIHTASTIEVYNLFAVTIIFFYDVTFIAVTYAFHSLTSFFVKSLAVWQHTLRL